ncbi:MAG: NAD(P)-dependent oxidoreductase [Pseudomonadota bacterium]|nr:NAD(P)-dependent oxidoreductase [Gammaproteobacteria bacterium]
MNTLFDKDLEHILKHTSALWGEMKDAHLFITGGTGFFGCWLLESLLWLNSRLNLNLRITVLTRNVAAFAKKMPHLVHRSGIHYLEGDVRDFAFPKETVDYILHAATDVSMNLTKTNPALEYDVIMQGTKHVLDFAKEAQTKRMLFVSSGAVYGPQPYSITHISEDYSCQPDPNSAYAVGKFKAEQMCCDFAKMHGLIVTIARSFALVGPYLPIDIHFAMGNFIRDAMQGGPIIVEGDGTPYRSYLYAADLVIWLWHIFLRGENCRPYNVGSDHAITIAELAHVVSQQFDTKPVVKILKTPDPHALPARYVPSIERAKKELGLFPYIDLIEGIQRTKVWWLQR